MTCEMTVARRAALPNRNKTFQRGGSEKRKRTEHRLRCPTQRAFPQIGRAEDELMVSRPSPGPAPTTLGGPAVGTHRAGPRSPAAGWGRYRRPAGAVSGGCRGRVGRRSIPGPIWPLTGAPVEAALERFSRRVGDGRRLGDRAFDSRSRSTNPPGRAALRGEVVSFVGRATWEVVKPTRNVELLGPPLGAADEASPAAHRAAVGRRPDVARRSGVGNRGHAARRRRGVRTGRGRSGPPSRTDEVPLGRASPLWPGCSGLRLPLWPGRSGARLPLWPARSGPGPVPTDRGAAPTPGPCFHHLKPLP